MNARQVAAQLQELYSAHLPKFLQDAETLLQTVPKTRTKLPRLVFVSLGQRIFLLLRDIADIFQTKVESGYHANATLARSLMETATTLLVLEKDNYGSKLNAFIQDAERMAEKRRDGLAKMTKSKSSEIAKAAQTEEGLASQVVQALDAVRQHAALKPSKSAFPNMADRCQSLGEVWLFMYHATYRELSEAVHGGFTKIPHSPSLAFTAPNQGAAVLYEHCRAMNYAFQFWGVTVVELCAKHADQEKVTSFRTALIQITAEAAKVSDHFSTITKAHEIVF